MVLADILKSTALKKKKKRQRVICKHGSKQTSKKFSENVKMKCIIFKNKKKFRGSENWASLILYSWLVQVLIIAFVHGLLSAFNGRLPRPWRSFALLSVKVQKFPRSRWHLSKLVNPCSGGCWQEGQRYERHSSWSLRRNDKCHAKDAVGRINCFILGPDPLTPMRLASGGWGGGFNPPFSKKGHRACSAGS